MSYNDDIKTKWISRYSLKFEGCRNWLRGGGDDGTNKNHPYAQYRLCPKGEGKSCVRGCQDGNSFVVGMSEFIETYVEARQEACREAMSKCGCDGEKEKEKCFTKCLRGTDHSHCIPNKHDLFVGPYCSGDGIYLQAYVDKDCTKVAKKGAYEKLNKGARLPYSNEPLVGEKCMDCPPMDKPKERALKHGFAPACSALYQFSDKWVGDFLKGIEQPADETPVTPCRNRRDCNDQETSEEPEPDPEAEEPEEPEEPPVTPPEPDEPEEPEDPPETPTESTSSDQKPDPEEPEEQPVPVPPGMPDRPSPGAQPSSPTPMFPNVPMHPSHPTSPFPGGPLPPGGLMPPGGPLVPFPGGPTRPGGPLMPLPVHPAPVPIDPGNPVPPVPVNPLPPGDGVPAFPNPTPVNPTPPAPVDPLPPGDGVPAFPNPTPVNPTPPAPVDPAPGPGGDSPPLLAPGGDVFPGEEPATPPEGSSPGGDGGGDRALAVSWRVEQSQPGSVGACASMVLLLVGGVALVALLVRRLSSRGSNGSKNDKKGGVQHDRGTESYHVEEELEGGFVAAGPTNDLNSTARADKGHH